MGRSRSLLPRSLARLLAALVVGLLAAPAFALPKVGTARPSIKLVDAWDRELDLSRLAQPLLVVYEDKDDGNTNAAIKDELAQLDKTSHYRKTVLHIAVVDVTPWDYWPARGIAKTELQKWTNKVGVIMYSDFTGSVQTTLDFTKGKSTVVLWGKDGKVLFSYAGPLPADKRKELVDLLRGLSPPPTP